MKREDKESIYVCMKWSEVKGTQSFLTLGDPVDHTVPGILQARIYIYIHTHTHMQTQNGILLRCNKNENFPFSLTDGLDPVLLPGKSHERRSLVGCRPWGRWESDTTERLPFHFSLACIGEGNGNPLQCSCLESPRDGGAWWAAIYGVAQSRTRLKQLSSSIGGNCL